jgi:hypothetical protein
MAQQRFCKRLEVGGGDKFHTKQSYNSIQKLEFTFIVQYFYPCCKIPGPE